MLLFTRLTEALANTHQKITVEAHGKASSFFAGIWLKAKVMKKVRF